MDPSSPSSSSPWSHPPVWMSRYPLLISTWVIRVEVVVPSPAVLSDCTATDLISLAPTFSAGSATRGEEAGVGDWRHQSPPWSAIRKEGGQLSVPNIHWPVR